MKQPHYIELDLPVRWWWKFTRKKRIRFSFNMWSFFQLYEKDGIELGDIENQDQERLLIDMVYNAACAGYLSEIDIPFTKQDAEYWLRWLNYKHPDSFVTLSKTLANSMTVLKEELSAVETSQGAEKKNMKNQ